MSRLRLLGIVTLVVALCAGSRWASVQPSLALAKAAPAAANGEANAAEPPPVRGLVERLDRRQRELDARDLELEARAATLRTLEGSVAAAVARLESTSVGAGAAGSSCRLRGGVTKIYEQMRAEQAAAILDRLDDETLRIVFASMDVRRIGAILAEMSRERAVAFTRTLARDSANAPLPSLAAAPR